MSVSNFSDIARAIYSKPPSGPGTVELGLDECAPPNASALEKVEILFEVLLGILIEGIKIKYGADANPGNLKAAQINELSQYVLSYGFSTHIRSDSITTPPPVSKEPKKELKDFSERFYDFERECWHEIYFGWVNIVITPNSRQETIKKV